MNFKDTLVEHELTEAKKLNTAMFLKKLSAYTSLDTALADLPSEYLEFFISNEKSLKKALTNLFEEYNPEGPGYLGLAPSQKSVTKKIKYKGQIILLSFDPEEGNWIVLPGFRSITKALSYGKTLIDEMK